MSYTTLHGDVLSQSFDADDCSVAENGRGQVFACRFHYSGLGRVAGEAPFRSRFRLAFSFVQMVDAKGAQGGGYSVEEVRARLSEIQGLANKQGINGFRLCSPPAVPVACFPGLV